MRNKKSGGFTLIELLIVIAIIGILAAVLIPNLLSARDRAFDAAAQSCANALATAEEIYAIDNAGDYADDFTLLNADTVNNCESAWVTNPGTSPAPASYDYTVSHSNSDTVFVVSPDGIVRQ